MKGGHTAKPEGQSSNDGDTAVSVPGEWPRTPLQLMVPTPAGGPTTCSREHLRAPGPGSFTHLSHSSWPSAGGQVLGTHE